MDSMIDATVPKSIRRPDLNLSKYGEGLTEIQLLTHFKALASMNKVMKSFLGMGYYDTHVSTVILRNILENLGWYT